MECSLCNISGEGTDFYRGIHKKLGLIDICKKCYVKDRIPLVETKKLNFDEINKRESVRERLSRLAHLGEDFTSEVPKKKENVVNTNLNDIIEKNLKIGSVPKEAAKDLIDNFNWVIMRKRRMMKFTRTELGEAIHESPIIIEALEKGSLPRNYPTLIKKIENYLRVNLFVGEREFGSADILAETKSPRGILVSELKKTYLEKEIEDRALNEIVKEKKATGRIHEKEIEEDSISLEELDLDKIKELVGEPVKEKKKVDDDLSQKDIEDLIFRKK